MDPHLLAHCQGCSTVPAQLPSPNLWFRFLSKRRGQWFCMRPLRLAMPCWWVLNSTKQLSMAATLQVPCCVHAWRLGQTVEMCSVTIAFRWSCSKFVSSLLPNNKPIWRHSSNNGANTIARFMAHALNTFYCRGALGATVNPDTIGCVWTGVDREIFESGEKNFADSKIFGYVWTGPKRWVLASSCLQILSSCLHARILVKMSEECRLGIRVREAQLASFA